MGGILFPGNEFFTSLQKRMNADPSCTEHLDPSEAYCGFEIDDRLFVLEFDGRECSAIVTGGNELDLDFVVAGPRSVWKRALEGIGSGGTDVSLPSLVEHGDLEVRSVDDEGESMARRTLPFLQIFLEGARGLDVDFG